MSAINHATGAGLGFRRGLMGQMKSAFLDGDCPPPIDFFEVSPENWINSDGIMGGNYDRQLRAFTERYPFICHGLSLSIGSHDALDEDLLRRVKAFMQRHGMTRYTEHLSWCRDQTGHLYELLPIPCTKEAVDYVAERIMRAQDILGGQIGFENASYYYRPHQSEMSDDEFISAVCQKADCLLHLDVNNIYVNAQNFGYDAQAYLRGLPLERTCYLHVAGHFVDDDGFIIDTHGSEVIDPVWALLDDAYDLMHAKGLDVQTIPTCLERDFNLPHLSALMDEVAVIKRLQTRARSARVS